MRNDAPSIAGWLKFIYIYFWVMVVTLGMGVVLSLYLQLFPNDSLDYPRPNMIDIVVAMAQFMMVSHCLKVFRNREPRAVRVITALLVAYIMFDFGNAAVNYLVYSTVFPASMSPMFICGIVLYMNRSVRAKDYYHLTVKVRGNEIKTEDSIAAAHGLAKMGLISIGIITVLMLFIYALLQLAQ